MLRPLLDDGVAVQYAANLEGAIQGLAVPTCTYDRGVQSVDDLVANGDRFERTIYAIDAGAAMTRAFQNAVEDDYMGLDDREVLPSSVAGMLSQVERRTRRNEAVVFHGWKPHWMDIKFDIRFLEADPENQLAGLETTVYTIVADGWPGRNPEMARFLEQFDVPVATQSEWIFEFSHEERDPGPVAVEWIEANMDRIAQWVEGVEAADGGTGIEAVRAAFGS